MISPPFYRKSDLHHLKKIVGRVWIFSRRKRFFLEKNDRLKAIVKMAIDSIMGRESANLNEDQRGHREACRPHSFILRKIDHSLCRYAGNIAFKQHPVAVICEFAWTAKALDYVPDSVLKICDTHDIQHLRRKNAQASGSDLPYHDCTREEECGELSRADILLAIQEKEFEALIEMCPNSRVVLAEHAVTELRKLSSPEESKTVFFVGNLYDPNVVGLKSFLSDAWPKIATRVPNAQLVVCGKVCEAFDEKLKNVQFKGVVEDLLPYYANAAVVINPVTYGSGLKIKTVEALSFGKCLVSTQAGAYGIRHDDAPFVVCDSIAEMSDQIVFLLENVSERKKREQKTWDYAVNRFSPNAVYGEFEKVLSGRHELATGTKSEQDRAKLPYDASTQAHSRPTSAGKDSI